MGDSPGHIVYDARVNLALGTRRSCALIVSSLVVALSPACVPVSAHASTGQMHTCTSDEISNGKVMRQITLANKQFGLTHAHLRRIPRGVKFKRTVTMETTNVLSASIKASTTIKAEENAWFEKASVEASVEVGGAGSHTTKTTVSEQFTVPKARHDRMFAFFDGNEYYSFRMHRRKCSRAGQQDSYGKLKSFSKVDESGAVLCPHSRYKSGSQKYQIALHSGC
jgi:hypothetical protein